MSRSPGERSSGPAAYLAEWSRLHGGAGTEGLVGLWLRLTHRVARPLARAGVAPGFLTAVGLALAAVPLVPAAAGGRWLIVAGLSAALSGFLDNLDGAVAVLRGRVTRWGYVLDSTCDRLAEACSAGALWLAGAPGWACVLAAGASWLQEYVRARAGAAGLDEVGVVTVAERPTRVIVTAAFLVAAGAVGEPLAGPTVALGALLWAGLGLVGTSQVLVMVRRRTAAPERGRVADGPSS